MPAVRYGIVNSPSPVVAVVELTLVATFVAVTVTPGSTPPDLSLTRPVMAPRNSCAGRRGRHRKRDRERAAKRFHRILLTDTCNDHRVQPGRSVRADSIDGFDQRDARASAAAPSQHGAVRCSTARRKSSNTRWCADASATIGDAALTVADADGSRLA